MFFFFNSSKTLLKNPWPGNKEAQVLFSCFGLSIHPRAYLSAQIIPACRSQGEEVGVAACSDPKVPLKDTKF